MPRDVDVDSPVCYMLPARGVGEDLLIGPAPNRSKVSHCEYSIIDTLVTSVWGLLLAC